MAGSVEEAKSALRSAEADVRTSYNYWMSAQADALVVFLDGEAKLTAVQQAAHTEEIAADIPRLREALALAAREAAESLREWANERPESEVLSAGAGLVEEVQTHLRFAVSGWAKLLREAGYQSGSRAEVESAWYFYDPQTGHARSPRFPLAPESRDYRQALSALSAARDELRKATAAAGKARAADLWG